MKKRTYIVKQEKGSDVWSVACDVTRAMFDTDREFDFADLNGWSDKDIYDTSLTDRYWEVFVSHDESLITPENADYKFEMCNDELCVGLREVYMIM